MVSKDPVALLEELYAFYDLAPEEQARLEALISKAGWPLRCPRCHVDTVLGGWDVDTNQCRECWKRRSPEAAVRALADDDRRIAAMIETSG